MPANLSPQSPVTPLPLRPLHLPEPPGLWPPALGWWLLAGVFLLLVAIIWWLLKYQRRLRYRSAALQELKMLEQSACSDSVLLASLSALLRRSAVLAFPASGCAGLQGDDWLKFLDAHLSGADAFSTGPGRCLGTGPYQRQPEFDRAGLLNLSRRWLKQLPAQPRRGR